MIQAFHVYKQYDRESSALSDITLHIKKGEFSFLTGSSGAGKTTFLKLIFREELPSQGQILVGGRNVTAIPERQIPELRRSIGVVFQDFKLLKRKTILENVAFVLRILAVPVKEQKRRAFAALKSVGLHHKMHAYPCSSRAASSSGWPSRARSSTSPCSSWPTSRRATSTPTWPTRSWTSSRTSTRAAPRCSSPPTTAR